MQAFQENGTARTGLPGQGAAWARPDSLWEATACPAPELPRLREALHTDTVVIGGGFTGLSTALHLAEAGHRVAVLEASVLGRGASGRNNGQVIPTLTRPDPDDLVARFGADAGERFVALIRDSASYLFDLVRRHGLDCAAEQTGWIQPAHTPGRLRISERRVEQWSRRGAPVELLDRAAVTELLGTDAYHGGFINRSGGHINPLSLVRELARAATAKGASIFVESPALAVRREGNLWTVRTPGGEVTADALVLATNAYTAGIFPEIRKEVVPVLSWQMATAPLGATARETILPGRHAMSDTHGDLRFMRYDQDGRLVTGGALVFAANGHDRLKPVVSARLREMFPQIGEVAFDFVWNGYIGMTRDYTPRVHRLGPNGFAWAGCNGRGVALSVSMGRELAAAATGRDPAELALPITEPTPLPFHGLLRRVAPAMLLLYRWRDAREVA